MLFSARSGNLRKSIKRSLHIKAATNVRSALSLRAGSPSSNALLFLRLLRSPGHLTFVTANVALLVHLQMLSTRHKHQLANQFELDLVELQRFDETVLDLDSETELIQSQINLIKQAKRKDSEVRPTQNGFRSGLLSPQLVARRLRAEHHSENQYKLAHSFASQRVAVKLLAELPELLEKLFPETTEAPVNESLVDYKAEKKYTSPLQNSLMLLSSLMLKQFLVELNLKQTFNDEALLNSYPDSSYLTESNLSKSFTERDRASVASLLESLAEDGKSVHLKDILADVGDNVAFNSVGLKREDFYNYKSAHWLNYSYSDVTHLIEAGPQPRFQSPVVNDEEYLTKITALFSQHKADTHPFRHINLALGLAKLLANGGVYSPSLSIFRVLLDKFGELRMYSYQSLVYDALPSFENGDADPLSERPDADSFTRSLYVKLIEEDPEYLQSLIRYETRNEHYDNLKYLLNFLEPDGKQLPSFIPLFFSNKVVKDAALDSRHEPVLVSLSTIENALDTCAQLGDYERMDRLLIKLFASLVTTAEGVRIALNKLADLYPTVTKMSPTTSYKVLLTDKVLKTLGETYVKRNDVLRLQWLQPYVHARLQEDSSSAALRKLGLQLEAITPKSKAGKPKTMTSSTKAKSDKFQNPKLQQKILSRDIPISSARMDRVVSMAA
ncbi:hypothetical protein PUMCH_000895 [Australozyma saopauloensis]|uniref:ATPase expression protein 1 n=1 Tax=Australozyma saopauloensis TaxID=291208 RepID=A0AAX4H592_9ASCO|nr:hypothetical protein PUMCH_000895 [[Candida] saopauloensis]